MATSASRRYNSLRIRKFRRRAFARQHGRCYYCQRPMLEGDDLADFAVLHGLTCRQALQLRCTAEHLQARQDGGMDTEDNLVAACRRCNAGRHHRREPPNPERFMRHVRNRPGWHGFAVAVGA